MKRLFIFAGYDPADNNNGIIDNSVISYVRALSELGDVCFYMDNDVQPSELVKIKPYTIYNGANRHGEYDFGSYKRGYIWARDNGILSNYDVVYFVNDSMYLTGDLMPLIKKMESGGTDVFCACANKNHGILWVQTVFFGLTRRVAVSLDFNGFISTVKKQPAKGEVCYAYEQGFTRFINGENKTKTKFTVSAPYKTSGRGIYNDLRKLFNAGFPLMKKLSFVRKHGALGRQIRYILNRSKYKNAIMENANHIYGAGYMKWLLASNPFKIIWRNVKHIFIKIFKEGI